MADEAGQYNWGLDAQQQRGVSIRGQMVLLGTGTSVGVPAIGCQCAVCHSANPRDNRLAALRVSRSFP